MAVPYAIPNELAQELRPMPQGIEWPSRTPGKSRHAYVRVSGEDHVHGAPTGARTGLDRRRSHLGDRGVRTWR
ncbi:hypothetical protein ACFYNY_35800 [Streptomyces sp. NPDC006530]|uniref:hypothetical protein n=1 Tax=Streptomyces sp. NPDC006530 TaxID=3364750 RepID=UPI00369D9BEE